MNSSHHAEAVTHVQDSDTAVVLQEHSPFSVIQNIERIERFDKRLDSGKPKVPTAVINSTMAKGGFQLNSMRWIHIMKGVLQILDLPETDPKCPCTHKGFC